MKQSQLEKEIRALQDIIYRLAKETNEYSYGTILKVSQELDKKFFCYQKLKNSCD
ncbi:Spo0E family sporulation regulatory protein-aspartic acid phosphatase [Priestia flexa]